MEKPLRVGLIADVQYCPCEPKDNRYYRKSRARLREALRTFTRERPAFIVQLGDLIERGGENFPPLLEELRAAPAPVFHVLGNHDYEVELQVKNRLTAILQMPHRYYHFSRPGWRFVVLDGNDLSFYVPTSDSAATAEREGLFAKARAQGRPQAKTWNGGLGQKQMDWLEKVLVAAGREDQRVVVFCHFPVFPEGVHNLWNDAEVMALLARHPHVVAYIAGHNHQGDYGELAGIHFLTLRAMVDFPRETAYAVLKLYSDSLVVNGYGREPDRVLRLKPRPERAATPVANPSEEPQRLRAPSLQLCRSVPAPGGGFQGLPQ